MNIKKGIRLFVIGMMMGIVSQLMFNYNNLLGILGYFITVMVVIGITFKDDN